MSKEKFDLVVIGGGPAGYTAAVKAAQSGMKTLCIEKRSVLGGTCLNVGCVPSKALLESSERFFEASHAWSEHGITADNIAFSVLSMMARKEKIVSDITKGVSFLFKQNGVHHLQGQASFVNANSISVQGEETVEIEFEKALIATGSLPRMLNNVQWDGEVIGDSTAALSYSEVPKHLIVIGAGAVGLELGSVWKRLGAEVTVLEFMDTILPGMDTDLTKQAARYLKRQKLQIKTGVKVVSAKREGDLITVETDKAGTLISDRLLMAAGRIPNTEGLNLQSAGVDTDERGFIKVNDRCETSNPKIFAAGDVAGGILLAHKASEEATACIEAMNDVGIKQVRQNPLHIPAVVYTQPELASVGFTEDILKNIGKDYLKGESLFRANARARAMNAIDGSIKVLADKETKKILGVHIIGPMAGEIISTAALAIKSDLSVESTANLCTAHPSLSETLKEACTAALQS